MVILVQTEPSFLFLQANHFRTGTVDLMMALGAKIEDEERRRREVRFKKIWGI